MTAKACQRMTAVTVKANQCRAAKAHQRMTAKGSSAQDRSSPDGGAHKECRFGGIPSGVDHTDAHSICHADWTACVASVTNVCSHREEGPYMLTTGTGHHFPLQPTVL